MCFSPIVRFNASNRAESTTSHETQCRAEGFWDCVPLARPPLMYAHLSLVSYPPASKLHAHAPFNLNKHSRLATICTSRHALAAKKIAPTLKHFKEVWV